ncbi:MAG TPA: metalloregulator ArsR/SmtB family transcription factor [Acidimicrobiales bacterium]|nr:metalloregulator ArsR/SmtB family transcription factor [Acidimicrobiales bacterium]
MTTQVGPTGARTAGPAAAAAACGDDLCCSSVIDAPLGRVEADELARVLSALADPVRLRLLSLLAASGSVCSCDLEAPLQKSQPTVSHHTRLLAQAGLIVGEKRGRWTWWSVREDRLEAVRRALGG